MQYSKQPLSFSEQADLLISRGLIADRDLLISRLQSVNYYRLSAYLYPYRKDGSDDYVEGTTFDTVWNHYVFDRQLRILVMDGIERIEVAIRTQLSYLFSHRYDAFGYLDQNNLPRLTNEKYNSWLENLRDEVNRSSETFIIHFFDKYGDYHQIPPVWVIIEVMSFGKLLTFFNGVNINMCKEIAKTYDIDEVILKSWLHSLNTIRNTCAHHGRLWNRELSIKPFIPRIKKYPEWHTPYSMQNNRIFIILTVIKYLLSYIAPNSQWDDRLCKLINKYPEISIGKMGFPEDWKNNLIWKSCK